MSPRHVWAVVTGIVWAGFIAGVGVAEVDGGMRVRTLLPVGLLGAVCMLSSLMVTLRLWRPTPEQAPIPQSLTRPRVAPSPLAHWTPPAQPVPQMTAWDWVTRPGPRGPHDSTRVLEVVQDARPVAVTEREPEPAPSLEPLERHLEGYAAGAHPETDDGRRPDVEHLQGFAEGAVDKSRRDEDDEPE